MIRSFPARTAGRIFGYAVPALLLLPLLSGCDQEYPADMRYPPRSDPVFTEGNGSPFSGEEPLYPDRPGQLPIMTMSNAEEPTNPLFGVYKKLASPNSLPGEQQQMLTAALEKHFGTPAAPKIDGLRDQDDVKLLQVDPETLARGSHYYRIHCLHCHGLPGDGRGPTAFWVNPHPRDYRQGIFKFVSVNLEQGVQKPSREDLLRTLRQGIDGTSMPSFALLGEKDLNFLASYVIHLSLRGEVEYYVLQSWLQGKELDRPIEEMVGIFGQRWVNAQDPSKVIQPAPYPAFKNDEEIKAAVQRGKTFFDASGTGSQGGCLKCHTDYGRQAKFRYDAWGTLVRPTDLTLGIYRGGRRPIDLYWRVHAGINGSGMAAFGDTKTTQIQSLWDVVKFVEILPYPAMRKKYGIHLD